MSRKDYATIATNRIGWMSEVLRGLIVLLLCTAAFVSSTYNPFLYFRF